MSPADAVAPATPAGAVHAVLIGPTRQENLALQYLAASAAAAGFRTTIASFDGRDDGAGVAREVERSRPLLVGLGLSFQHHVAEYLELAELLRRRGYAGHVTAGGHVPTFSYEALLQHSPALDSCVRHDGEHTFVELLERLARGASPAGLPGLVWREGDGIALGPPRPLTAALDELPLPERPREPYLVAGLPIAFLLTSRGCSGECTYCSISAFARSAAGARLRLREVEPVADEIAGLARRGVELVFVQDDLFVLPDERAAVRRLDALRAGLDRRGVGRVGFWIKGRPDSITPAVLEAARRLGAIHLFLGVESAVAERLAYLGRTHSPDDARRALDRCRESGVHPSFNLMLFDPESTLEQIAVTVDFAASTAELPWNVCRTEIYPGTELFARLARAGRLLGDHRSYGYVMTDPRAELAFRILRVSLHERAFAMDSLLNRLISLTFAAQAHRWRFPGPESERLGERVAALGRATRLDTVEMLRHALEAAATIDPGDAARARALALDEGLAAGARDAPRAADASRLWELFHARGRALLARERPA